jgi:malate/lactate dehydrogenase
MDLLEVNAGIVTDVTKKILEHSEDPIIIVVTKPSGSNDNFDC